MVRRVFRFIPCFLWLGALAMALPCGAEVRPQEGGERGVLELTLPRDVAERVGHQVWLNETGGIAGDIVAWNNGEAFASLGIGHFIWFPAGKPAPFAESFPRLLQYYRQQKVRLPAWLDTTPFPPCPWPTRAAFLKAKDEVRLAALRTFLHETKGVQVQYMVERVKKALDIMLSNTPEDAKRRHIGVQFARVIKASPDLYPLIDYINFKGEGTNPDETAYDARTKAKEGWGLRHALLAMTGVTDDPRTVLAEFSEATAFVLLRRIRNNPAGRRWQEGWLKRVATYRKPLVPAAGQVGARRGVKRQ